MSLLDELEKLKTEGEPQTLDELFNQSKEGMMSDRVISDINGKMPQMRTDMMNEMRNMMNEMKTIIATEIKNQVSQIKVRDGKTPVKGKDYFDGEKGEDGKDTVINKDNIISEIMAKMPKVSIGGGKRGGGGSTMRVDNLSSQANGSSKTFTTTYRIGSSHLLFYSSFPTLFLPTTDYTVSGTTITLGSEVNAPVAGQSLAIIYESAD